MSKELSRLYLVVLMLGLLIGLSAAWLGHARGPTAWPDAPSAPSPLPPRPRPEGVVFAATRQEPEATPDLLDAGTPVVYAFYNLPELPTGQVAQATWTHDGRPAGKISRADIQPDPQVAGRGVIVLRAPQGKLDPGIYELELRTERRRFRASFVVATQAAAILALEAPAEAHLTISQQVTARGIGRQGEPAQATAKLGSKDKVFFVFRYEGAEPGMAVTVKWWGGQTEIKAARQEITLASTSGWAHAWLQAETGLPPGTYRVTASTSGDAHELTHGDFTIR